jgi:hypothetical protein
MTPPDYLGTCETCAWWTREPELANALRRPDGSASDLGVCQVNAPVVVGTGGFRMSVFPEVRAHRFCSRWEPEDEGGDGGDGGGGEEVTNVVPLRGAA